MTKIERIEALNTQLTNAIKRRDAAMLAGNFHTANKWIAKIVRFKTMIDRIEWE